MNLNEEAAAFVIVDGISPWDLVYSKAIAQLSDTVLYDVFRQVEEKTIRLISGQRDGAPYLLRSEYGSGTKGTLLVEVIGNAGVGKTEVSEAVARHLREAFRRWPRVFRYIPEVAARCPVKRKEDSRYSLWCVLETTQELIAAIDAGGLNIIERGPVDALIWAYLRKRHYPLKDVKALQSAAETILTGFIDDIALLFIVTGTPTHPPSMPGDPHYSTVVWDSWDTAQRAALKELETLRPDLVPVVVHNRKGPGGAIRAQTEMLLAIYSALRTRFMEKILVIPLDSNRVPMGFHRNPVLANKIAADIARHSAVVPRAWAEDYFTQIVNALVIIGPGDEILTTVRDSGPFELRGISIWHGMHPISDGHNRSFEHAGVEVLARKIGLDHRRLGATLQRKGYIGTLRLPSNPSHTALVCCIRVGPGDLDGLRGTWIPVKDLKWDQLDDASRMMRDELTEIIGQLTPDYFSGFIPPLAPTPESDKGFMM